MNKLFTITRQDQKTRARRGIITTAHGVIDTPMFLPVGTQASVKSLSQAELWRLGARMILGNTYHLYLRPGPDLVAQAGGLHKFQSWDGALFTDSGGFQVFSLGLGKKTRSKRQAETQKNRASMQPATQEDPTDQKVRMLAKVDDDGVTFRSHLDGSIHRFTPESSLQIQHKLGADIILSFDECPPHPATWEYTRSATDRTHRWAVRGLEYHQKNKQPHQFLYGIVQGGAYQDLRQDSAKFIDSLAFDGYCIGGVSVGESKQQMKQAVEWTAPLLDPQKPRHLLGVGDIDDIFMGVDHGMDTFDCVTPTRWARTGTLVVHPDTAAAAGSANKYRLIVTNGKFQNDFSPPDPKCDCWVCTTYTRAYLNHLFRAKELLGIRLASYHNVYTLVNLSYRIQQSIEDDTYQSLKEEFHL